MDHLLYSLYRRSSIARHWLRKHISRAGILFVSLLLLTAAIGMDTNRSIVFQFFCILAVLGLAAVCCSLVFKAPSDIKVKRHLPKFATAGEPFRYMVILENQGQKVQSGLHFFDNVQFHYPSFIEFKNSREPEEEKRNRFDQIFKAYRWHWLMKKQLMAWTEERSLDDLPSHFPHKVQFELTPLRRGILRFNSGSCFSFSVIMNLL